MTAPKHDEARLRRIERSVMDAGKSLEFIRVPSTEHGYKVYWYDAKPNENGQSVLHPIKRDVTDLVELLLQVTERTIAMTVDRMMGDGK